MKNCRYVYLHRSSSILSWSLDDISGLGQVSSTDLRMVEQRLIHTKWVNHRESGDGILSRVVSRDLSFDGQLNGIYEGYDCMV